MTAFIADSKFVTEQSGQAENFAVIERRMLLHGFQFHVIYEYLTRNFCVCVVPLYIDNPYPTAFPYGNGMVLHFYQQQESSTTKTVHKVINKGLKAYV